MKFFMLCIFNTLLLTANAFASGSENDLFAKHFNHQNGIAVHGYDVVAYTQNLAVQGNEKFEVNYLDVTFRFANQQNAETFAQNPQKYLPAYGGWCATAIGMMSKKLDVTPSSFVVQDGRTYLFSTTMGPAKEEWVKNQPDLRMKADANWAQISSH